MKVVGYTYDGAAYCVDHKPAVTEGTIFEDNEGIFYCDTCLAQCVEEGSPGTMALLDTAGYEQGLGAESEIVAYRKIGDVNEILPVNKDYSPLRHGCYADWKIWLDQEQLEVLKLSDLEQYLDEADTWLRLTQESRLLLMGILETEGYHLPAAYTQRFAMMAETKRDNQRNLALACMKLCTYY